MTREQALKQIRQLLGPKALIQVNDHGISSPEKREFQAAKSRQLRAERDALQAELTRRTAEILAQYPEITDMRAKLATLRKPIDESAWMATYYKFTAGTDGGLFFHVVAQGDTWEDVVTKIKAAKAAK